MAALDNAMDPTQRRMAELEFQNQRWRALQQHLQIQVQVQDDVAFLQNQLHTIRLSILNDHANNDVHNMILHTLFLIQKK